MDIIANENGANIELHLLKIDYIFNGPSNGWAINVMTTIEYHALNKHKARNFSSLIIFSSSSSSLFHRNNPTKRYTIIKPKINTVINEIVRLHFQHYYGNKNVIDFLEKKMCSVLDVDRLGSHIIEKKQIHKLWNMESVCM